MAALCGAQAFLYKRKQYLPVMKATNSDSKQCQVSFDVCFQSPSCSQRRKACTFLSQARRGRPHRLLLGGVQSKQRRNHVCRDNVLMHAANFHYFIVTTAMYHSAYACVPRVQNHMPRRRSINPQAEGSCDAAFFAFHFLQYTWWRATRLRFEPPPFQFRSRNGNGMLACFC